ncbi:MAG TPA: cellulase family glycosylhydrolase [Ktedonobacterales bacterium]
MMVTIWRALSAQGRRALRTAWQLSAPVRRTLRTIWPLFAPVRKALRTSRARLYLAVAIAAVVLAILFGPLLLERGETSTTVAAVSTGQPAPTQQGAALIAQLALHVHGNLLVTRAGRSVTLHGVNRDGSDFLCAEGTGIFDGPIGANSTAALLAWHINAVRIPMNEACWLGMPGVPSQYGGSAYQNAIAAYVQALTEQGIYVILDLHKSAPGNAISAHKLNPMPDADHSVAFWSQVATRFRGNGMALFDLFNEPHAVSWQCLRDGGSCAGAPYRTAGMQTLVDTVRATGARNVIMVSGLRYTNDLSQWLTYEPHDPLNNIAASWHVYTLNSVCARTACYDRILAPVAARVPLIAGEFGADQTGASCLQSAEDQVSVMLDWLDQHQANYIAFSWNVGKQRCGSLALINDYAGNPHAPNGTAYKAHLLALFAAATTPPESPPHGRVP